MQAGIDLSVVLEELIRNARGSIAGSERGSLLVRDGEDLVYRAAVGYDLARLRSWRIPLNGQSYQSVELQVHRATDWYVQHMPADLLAEMELPDERAMVVVPIVSEGQLAGFLNVDQPTTTSLTSEQQMMLKLVAMNVALVLERRGLYSELTRSTEEVRLLGNVLDAVASSNGLHDVIHTLGYGIKNVLPYRRWHTVQLGLLEKQQTLHFYDIVGRRINPFWSTISKGITMAGRDLGIDVELVLGDESGASSQVAIIDAAIRAGVHGIAVAAINPVAVEAAIRRARQAGIPVVTYDTPPVEDSEALLYIGTDNCAGGRLSGEMMARLLPAGGQVGVGAESLSQLNVRERLDGFRAEVADTRISLLPPCVDNHDVNLSRQLASATIAEHPDLVGVYGINASTAPSWGEAIKAAGKEQQIKVVGFDLVADTIAMLREGLVDVAIAQNEYDIGYRCVQILCQMIVHGVEETLAQLPASRFIDTGIDAVTLEKTPWSISLTEYLNKSSRRRPVPQDEADAVARYGKPIKLLMVGIGEKVETSTEEQVIPFEESSLASQVLAAGQPLIIDPVAPEYANLPDAIRACQRGMRTIVSVPLTDRGSVVGLISLESQMEHACTPDDLALIERIAHIGGVVIANARLFDQVTVRTHELESAYQRQALLLQTIAELSSPVAPIAPGILVMPLIGNIDTQRATRFMETLLHEISARQAHVVLIDITGVSVVDTAVANHIVQAGQAARLLGAEVVLVGITPAVAQTIVHLSVEMPHLVCRADLASGFAYALERRRGRIIFSS
jgi:ABC-type sugar transport system substrate-binding protein/putative methionine-R-sulfoxide reductase with GAF domain